MMAENRIKREEVTREKRPANRLGLGQKYYLLLIPSRATHFAGFV